MAQVLTAHGLFIREQEDKIKTHLIGKDFNFLENFIKTKGSYSIKESEILPKPALSISESFKKYYKLGIDLRRRGAYPAFKKYIEALSSTDDILALTARIALSHGIFTRYFNKNKYKKDLDLVRGIFKNY